MGIAMGRFVINTHVHAQRHAVGFKKKGIKPNFETLSNQMKLSDDVILYDNTARLLYDMDRYGVDMCVIIPAFAMTDEINAKIVETYPDKFIAMCQATDYYLRCRRGELEWSMKDHCVELDELLSTGNFRGGIGEGIPINPRPKKPFVWQERFEEICMMMEVARKHNVPVSYHTGNPTGYAGAGKNTGVFGRPMTDWGNPMLVNDIAPLYRDVPIIMHHGGMQGGLSEMFMDATWHAAGANANVYVETGLYWAELYDRPLRDPNIGIDQLVWGTDWGASLPQQWNPGGNPETYVDQSRRDGIPAHQVDDIGWSLRQVDKLNIPQDDLNLLLGGNAVRIFKLEDKLPLTRMFKKYIK